jgi:hypothetical protein
MKGDTQMELPEFEKEIEILSTKIDDLRRFL